MIYYNDKTAPETQSGEGSSWNRGRPGGLPPTKVIIKEVYQMTEYSHFDLEQDDIDGFKQLCPLNEFRILAPARIEKDALRIVPDGLWDKSDNLFLMSSGSATATAYCMVNCSRYDNNASAIDHEPILFAHVGGTPRLNGIIVHHGNWKGRTQPVPSDFETYLENTGLGNHYPMAGLPTSKSGPIEIIKSVSQIGAFDKGVRRIVQMATEASRE